MISTGASFTAQLFRTLPYSANIGFHFLSAGSLRIIPAQFLVGLCFRLLRPLHFLSLPD
jgi:hypothetical protein